MATVEIDDFELLALYSGGVIPQIMQRLKRIEDVMSELSGAVGQQRDAINALTQRINELDAGALQEQVNQLTAALAEQSAAYAALQELFAQDEVADDAALADANQRLTDATAQVESLRGQVETAANDIATGVQGIQENTATLDTLARSAQPEG